MLRGDGKKKRFGGKWAAYELVAVARTNKTRQGRGKKGRSASSAGKSLRLAVVRQNW